MNNEPVTAYIGVGSNIEPRENVVRALRLLKQEVRITGISTFYWTLPWGGRAQEKYLNGIFQIKTLFPPIDIKFQLLRKIEAQLKRVRSDDVFASRTIDLDLLLYGDLVLDEEHLRLPDPDIYSRHFIAFPLRELNPQLILPDTGKSIDEVVNALNEEGLSADKQCTEFLRQEWTKRG